MVPLLSARLNLCLDPDVDRGAGQGSAKQRQHPRGAKAPAYAPSLEAHLDHSILFGVGLLTSRDGMGFPSEWSPKSQGGTAWPGVWLQPHPLGGPCSVER